MQKTAIKITPADHGKRMTLEDFEHAEVQEGYRYELSRGLITVSDVPNPPHLILITAIKRQFYAYDLSHPGTIFTIATGSECKVLLEQFQSERHPDLAIYKTAPPRQAVWSNWIPELVVEVTSPDSQERDYEEKRAEYLHFGVREYWIVDAGRQEILVLKRRGGKWKEQIVKPPERYETKVLSGFALDCGAVFAAGPP